MGETTHSVTPSGEIPIGKEYGERGSVYVKRGVSEAGLLVCKIEKLAVFM